MNEEALLEEVLEAEVFAPETLRVVVASELRFAAVFFSTEAEEGGLVDFKLEEERAGPLSLPSIMPLGLLLALL